MQRKIVLHYDSFTIEGDSANPMGLWHDANPINAIAYDLHCLVFCEQQYDEGDTFFLPAQTWNGIDLPETTFHVHTLPDGLPGLKEFVRSSRVFHVHCSELSYDEWTIVDSHSGDTMTISLNWLTQWDGWIDNFSKILFREVNLHPGDVVAFHPFAFHHPDIPGMNRLRRFVFLPVYQTLEPLTPDDDWNPELD